MSAQTDPATLPPDALVAHDVPPEAQRSILPPPFAARAQGREKRKLGNRFGLTNFGVNLVRIAPGGISSIRHCHAVQDEFVYVLAGHPTLNTDDGPLPLAPGMCAGFRGGSGRAHNLANETAEDVWYLEIGDRSAGDRVSYPGEDLQGVLVDGAWRFAHRDGTPW